MIAGSQGRPKWPAATICVKSMKEDARSGELTELPAKNQEADYSRKRLYKTQIASFGQNKWEVTLRLVRPQPRPYIWVIYTLFGNTSFLLPIHKDGRNNRISMFT